MTVGGEERLGINPRDAAMRNLNAQGFQGREAGAIAALLTSNIQRDTAGAIMRGEPLQYTEQENLMSISLTISKTRSDVADPLQDEVNRMDWWTVQAALYEFLPRYTFTGDTVALTDETKAAMLLASFEFVTMDKGEKVTAQFIQSVDALRPSLTEYAKRVAGGDWQNLAAVANEFAESPAAQQVQQLASDWHAHYQDSLSEGQVQAADVILATSAIIHNPRGFLDAAHSTYKDAFGLDLAVVLPVSVDTSEGQKINRELIQKRVERLKEKMSSGQPALEEVLLREDATVIRDPSPWFAEDRVNVVDRLTGEGLQAVANKTGVQLPKDGSLSEGEMRRLIATKLIDSWYAAIFFASEAPSEQREAQVALAKQKIANDLTPFLLLFGRYDPNYNPDFPARDLDAYITDSWVRTALDDYLGYPDHSSKIRKINEFYKHYW